MRVQKRIIAALVLTILLCASVVTVYAHPGSTDSKGGHYVGGTTKYHYHHGYPAHQHTNGECPYDFDDKTGQNSGGSGDGNGSRNGSSGEKGAIIVPLHVVLWICFLAVGTIVALGVWVKVLKDERAELVAKNNDLNERYNRTSKENRQYYDGFQEIKKTVFLLMVECRRRWAVNNYIFRMVGLDPIKMRGQRFVRVLPHGRVYHNYMMCHPNVEAEIMLLCEAEKRGYQECMRCSFCGFDYPNVPGDFNVSFVECRDWLNAGNGDDPAVERELFEKITKLKVG